MIWPLVVTECLGPYQYWWIDDDFGSFGIFGSSASEYIIHVFFFHLLIDNMTYTTKIKDRKSILNIKIFLS